MELVKFAALVIAASAFASPKEFSIAIGPPVAANAPRMKMSAVLAVRLENCNAGTPTMGGSAEGIVDGVRRSVNLVVALGSSPNTFVVPRNWGPGNWVLAVNATCGEAKAGAIVPLDNNLFIREQSQFFSRPPTSAEIESTLKNQFGGHQ